MVVGAIDSAAKMALSALVPGEDPVYTEQDGGTLAVEKSTANDIKNKDYPLNVGSMKITGNISSDPSQVVQLKVMTLTILCQTLLFHNL